MLISMGSTTEDQWQPGLHYEAVRNDSGGAQGRRSERDCMQGRK